VKIEIEQKCCKQAQVSDFKIYSRSQTATKWGSTYITPGHGYSHYKSDQFEQHKWYDGVID